MVTLEERIRKFIAAALQIEEQKIVPAARFIDDLGVDSIDRIELVMKMEQEFQVEIPDHVANRLKSVGDVIENIQQSMDEQNKAAMI